MLIFILLSVLSSAILQNTTSPNLELRFWTYFWVGYVSFSLYDCGVTTVPLPIFVVLSRRCLVIGLNFVLQSGCGDSLNFGCSPPYFNGSPPSRADNPLVHDSNFIHQRVQASPSTLSKPKSLGRSSLGPNAAVRVEGFDCSGRDTRCSVPALAWLVDIYTDDWLNCGASTAREILCIKLVMIPLKITYCKFCNHMSGAFQHGRGVNVEKFV